MHGSGLPPPTGFPPEPRSPLAVRAGARPRGRGAYALPVVVVAGLAVGVVSGLVLIGNSSGGRNEPVKMASPSSPVVAGDEGAPAIPDASPIDAPEYPKTITLRFEVEPEDVDARIKVEDKYIDGMSYKRTIDEPTKIKIIAKADGFQRFHRKFAVDGDDVIRIRLKQRPEARKESEAAKPKRKPKPKPPTPNSNKPKRRKPDKPAPKPSGPSSLIDL